jgi:hypothetical protein
MKQRYKLIAALLITTSVFAQAPAKKLALKQLSEMTTIT